MKKKIFGSVFLTILLAISSSAPAEYPDRPITCVVCFEAGGATDISARALCDPAAKILGKPIVVTNKGGGTGSVALASVKKEKPDGYNIVTVAGGIFVSQHMRKLPFDLAKDFTPIIQYGDYPMPVLVKGDAPWKSFKELVDYAKSNPGKIRYGTSGSGSVFHLGMETLALQEGIKWTHIPFKGNHPATMALLGGHIEAEVCPTDFSFVRTGQMRLLTSLGRSRLPSFPEIPTLGELGYNIRIIHMAALIGPKDLPKAVVEKLHGAFKVAMEDPAFKKIMKEIEMPIIYRSPEDLAREMTEITEHYRKLVKEAGLRE